MRASLVSLPFLMISSLLLGCASDPESVANEEEMQESRETTIGTADFHFDQTKLRISTNMTRSKVNVRATLSREGAETAFAECTFGYTTTTEQAPAHDWLGCSKAGASAVNQFVLERVGGTVSLRQGERNFLDPSLTALGVDQDHRPHVLSADARQGNDVFALIDHIGAALGSVAGRPSELGPVSVESWWVSSRDELWLDLRYGAEAPFKRSNCYDSRIQPRLTTQPPSGVVTIASKDEIAQRTAAFIDGMVADITSGDSICKLH